MFYGSFDFDLWEDEDGHDLTSDHDYETEEYVCSRCNGAGCTKCEE